MEVSKIEQKIISILRDSGRPMRLQEISRRINILPKTKDYKNFLIAVENLTQAKILVKSARRRYHLQEYLHDTLITGLLRIEHGKGIVFSQEFKKPITIKRKNLFTAFDGDKVLVKLLGVKKNDRQYGEVIEIVARAEHKIIGTIEYDAGLYFLVPSDEKYYIDFVVPERKLKKATHGDRVLARLVEWNDPNKSPIAEVIQILGRAGDIGTESERIIYEFKLPKEFPKSVEKEAGLISERIPQSEIKRRLDLRNKLIITIDPIDAKDFDDAVSLERLPNGNYLLGVHIADVSYYVKEKSEIDREAFRRGTSVYLVDQVIPMLPEKLSNDLCSLRPNRVRLTYSVLMEFNEKLNLVNYTIAESVIKSKKRLNYDEVYEFLKSKREPKNEIEKLLVELNEFAQKLREKRFSQGGINFETVEVRFVLDEDKNPISAYLKESNIATQLIEECMLAANRTVAEHIQKLKIKHKLKMELPFIYRIHDEPELEKIKGVVNFFKMLSINAKNLTSAKAINNFLKQFEGRPEKPIVHQLLIRAMQKAIYSPDNIGHYGLGFRYYTHFTSPIRRYPDLVVHRLLKLYANGIPKDEDLRRLSKIVDIASDQSSEREIVAMEAERESVKLMLTILASENIGKDFTGTISGVTNFGLFVVLDSIYTEGLIPIRDLLDDYYVYDEKNIRLIGKRKGKIYKFGDRVATRIVEVDVEKRKVWLKLVEYLS
ncbi:ribonuclease R [Bacteroidetes/Chlorobi group bacterium Naka2016]|jgi:ribonuclease R|nr:MAG: ribonuclease R [Bacteroidetes/Chlorobi group bacterium Naka2016]